MNKLGPARKAVANFMNTLSRDIEILRQSLKLSGSI